MSKGFSVSTKYSTAIPRSQRRKGVEGRGGVVAVGTTGGVTDAATRSYVDGNFVGLAGDQIVRGIKDFVDGVKLFGRDIFRYDAEKDTWELNGNLVVTGGAAFFTKLEGFEGLDLTSSLNVDGTTISNEGGILKVIGGTGGGLDEDQLAEYLAENGYATQTWVTNQKYLTQANFTTANIKSTLGISDWALAATKPSYTFSEIESRPTTIAGYRITDAYTKTEVQENFLGINDIAVGAATLKQTATSTSYLVAAGNGFNVMNPWNTSTCWFGYGLPTGSTYATTNWRFGSSDGTGVASGNIHCGSVSIGGAKITYDSTKNAIILPTNVVIEGGLAVYTKLSGFTDLDVMGGVVTDGTTIHINSAGQLEVIGGTGSGGSGITLDDVADYLSDNDYITSSGNANSATNIVLGTVSPSSTTSYYPAMVTGTTNGSKYGIKVFGNPVRYALKVGTSSATGIAELILGNSTNKGTAGNSEGALCLYPATSSYYSILKASSSVSANYTNYLPKSSGTLLNENSLVTINGYSLVGSGDISISGGTSGDYLPLTGGTIDGALTVTGRITGQARVMIEHDSNPWVGLTCGSVDWYVQVTSSGMRLGESWALSVIIDASGNLTAPGSVTENSDRKLKNIEYEGEGIGLDLLKKVKVAKWHWKDSNHDKRLHIGGVADNLAEVMPEVVFESEEEDGTKISSIAYGKAGFSIAASLIAPVARHEDKIKELDLNIEKMQKELDKLRKSA